MNSTDAIPDAPIILALDDPRATLAQVGGKGANLARMARAGLPVPPGLLVTTAAYREFVAANGLEAVIAGALHGLDTSSPAALEEASAQIRAAFASGRVPRPILRAFTSAYGTLEGRAVAVRSSATAEDLPELSFAGQQDTFLNVLGALSLRRAIIDCWSSLWTARAIGYRARNSINQSDVALAVVVQAMVQSEASGVLFTANPLTGLRDETVIDATLGLGEALVSGQVEPDHYIVESATGRIRSRVLGAKAISIRGAGAGGVEKISADAASRQALPDAAIVALTALGQRVSTLYANVPQDIEWAWADDTLYLLQARPITSLFPLPDTLPPGEFALLFSMGSVQGMLDPFTPMGLEFFRRISAKGSQLFGYNFAPGEVPALHVAAQRIWLRFNPLLRNRLSQRIWLGFFSQVDAEASALLSPLLADVRVQPQRALPTPPTLRRIVGLLKRLAPYMAAAIRDPNASRVALEAAIEAHMAAGAAQAAATRTLSERIRVTEQLIDDAFLVLIQILPRMVIGMACFFRLLNLAERVGMPHSQALEMVRGLPHNVTTTMNLALWQATVAIRNDAAALAAFQSGEAAALAQAYLDGSLPNAAQHALAGFLHNYGMRGVAEIDCGRVRWREDPTQVVQMVQNYLTIADAAQSPAAVFARGAQTAQRTQAQLVAAVEKKLGPQQAALARAYVVRLHALAGLRETPKFSMIRIMGIVRHMLWEGYAQLVAAGLLEKAEDGFFLTLNELRAVDAGYVIDWKALVRERRAQWAREAQRKQLPLLLVSDGRTFYAGAGAAQSTTDASVLVGSPVSPGVVEGIVHIVFEPHGAELQPGEILVCPGTDPAWTPLFLTAGALVMELGGMMTHGSVVAREYGIPAVVGVTNATRRLQSGQRVRVDGSSGRVTVLDGITP